MTVDMPTNHTENAGGRARTSARGARSAWICFVTIALASLWVVPAGTSQRHSSPSTVTLDPPGSVDSRPFGIIDSGDVVGLYITADTRTHGFLLTRGVYTSIDVPGSIRTNAVGVAELRPESRGDHDRNHRSHEDRDRRLAVVGRYDTADPANPAAAIGHGYLLSDGVLTTIDHPLTKTFTVAAGINSSGAIVGRYRSVVDNRLHGFLLVDGAFTTIDYPGATALNGIAINAKGNIAGYYADSNGRSHGFVLRDGAFTPVDPADALETGSNGGVPGINSREVVGTYRVRPATLPCGCDGTRGFVYSLRDGSYTTFALPNTISTGLTGVNRRGDIVGTYHDGRQLHGLLLTRHGHD